MLRESRDIKVKNLQNSKNHFNSDSYLNELPKLYENEFNIELSDILNISKKEFFDNISSRVKYLINGKYKAEIYNNDKLQSSLISHFHHYEQKYNIYFEELSKFLEDLKHNKINDYKGNHITNFRKHCWRTDYFAKHNCNHKNKTGNFIPVYSQFTHKKSNYHNYKNFHDNKKEERGQLKYVMCIECHKVFFSNKFLNYCTYCDIDFYSFIIYNNENQNLLPAKWEDDHCELLLNQQISCPKCNGTFYLDVKYNILKCLKCKLYKSPKNIERICNICKSKFISDIIIYNPLEKDYLNDIMNNAIIGKNLARPSNIPCCQNINIFTSQFCHNKNCKGLFYLAKFNSKLIVFCSECKKIYIYEKVIWTCPECGKEFKDENLGSKYSSFILKNEFDSSRKYNKNSINSCIESSRRKIYDKNSVSSSTNRNFRNDKKSEPDLVKDLKKNIKSNNDKRINHKNNHNFMINKKETFDKYSKNTNEVSYNSKDVKSQSRYQISLNSSNQKKKNVRIHFLLSNNSLRENESSKKGEKKMIAYNRSETNLFDYKKRKGLKISPNRNNISNLKASLDQRALNRVKTEEDEKSQEKNKNKNNNNNNNNNNNIIFKRNKNYKKYNININEDKNNIFNLIMNQNDNKFQKRNSNINTKYNIYKENAPKGKHSSSSSNYLYRKNQLSVSQSKISKKELNIRKKEDINHTNEKKFSKSNRYLKYLNPFNKSITQKLNFNIAIKNYNTNTNSIKEETKLEEKETEGNNRINIIENKNKNRIKKEQKKEVNKIENNTKRSRNNKIIIKMVDSKRKRDNIRKVVDIRKIIADIKKKDNKKDLGHNKIIDNNGKKQNKSIEEKNQYNNKEKENKKGEQLKFNNKAKQKEKEKERKEKEKREKDKEKKEKEKEKEKKEKEKEEKEKKEKEKKEKDKEKEKEKNEKEGNNLLNLWISPKKLEIKLPISMPFTPVSLKGLDTAKSIKKINLDLTKLKKIESSNSMGEFKNLNKPIQFFQRNPTSDNDREKLLKEIEKERKRLLDNRPEDIVEHRKIDYRKDIVIEDLYLKGHPNLYDKMQKNLKQMIYRSHLPLFNPDLYQIEKKIGEGTNGAIYQVININNNKKYAMKKLIADSLLSLKYLIKEFDLVYDVVHPNILSIYGMNIKCFDVNTFSLCVLMDLGKSDWDIEINEHLDEHKYYTEEELISILKQLVSALLYLQRDKKIAHRDIKPENVLIFENNIYKLGDFGEAKGNTANNKLNTLRGTDIYMSPILYKGLKLSKEDVVHNIYKSDVFSLGYSFLYAVSLNHNIINEIRDLEDTEKIKNVLYRMMKPRYSENFIDLILQMIIIDEKNRLDFIGLDKLIKEKQL